jgi:hypothetical protein
MWTDERKNLYAQVAGRQVVNVIDAGAVSLVLDNGQVLQIDLEGDCCSSSYFADVKQFDELKGATIQSIEERDEASSTPLAKPEDDNDSSVSWHFLVFTTDKGHVTIDWRNDSNGYYDGTVLPALLGKAA